MHAPFSVTVLVAVAQVFMRVFVMRMSVAMIVMMMVVVSVVPMGMTVRSPAEIAERPKRDPQAERDQREAGER